LTVHSGIIRRLSALSPQQLNELAMQLQITRWQKRRSQGCRIFKAWRILIRSRHCEPQQIQNFRDQDGAVQSVITSADAAQAKTLAKQIQEWPQMSLRVSNGMAS